MESVNHILELLYDRGEQYYPPAELAGRASLTREQLDDRLALLRRRGHVLETDPARGVRLAQPVRLDAHLIERGMATKRIGRSAICFDEVDSTNDVAFDACDQVGADGLVVTAERQRLGRGRLGRRWISTSGANILMSVALVEAIDKLPQEALTIAAGLSVAEGVADACGLACQLKWPNDVLLDGAKAAGVLVEFRGRPPKPRAVVGIGINVNACPADEDIDSPATSLAAVAGRQIQRIEVLRAVLIRLDGWLVEIAAGRLDRLHDAWIARCGMLNQRIVVQCSGTRYVGRVLDVSPLEGLVLGADHGPNIHLPAAGSTVVG